MTSAIWIADLLKALAVLNPPDAAERRLVLEALGLGSSDHVRRSDPAPSVQLQQPPPDWRAKKRKEKASHRLPARSGIPLEYHSTYIEAPSVVDDIPQWVRSAAPLRREQLSHTSFRPARPSLLVPGWSRSIAAAVCSALADDGPIDVEALVQLAARQQAFVSVPRRPVPTLRHGVHLLVDRSEHMQPFLGDATALSSQIVNLLGGNRVKTFRFDQNPSRGVGTGTRPTWRQSYHPPYNGGAVVVLSDLGIGAGTTQIAEWLRFAANVRAVGSPLLVFVPYPPNRWPLALVGAIPMVPWDRTTTVSLARRVAAGERQYVAPPTRVPSPPSPNLEGAGGLLALAEASRPRVVDLARLLSFASRIEPELIRAMRLTLMPGEDVGLEGDLWFSPLVQARDPIAMVLLPDAAAELQRQLARPERRAQLDAAWHVISTVHQGLSPQLVWEEETAYFALCGDAQQSMEVNVGRVLNAMVIDAPPLARWVAQSLPRLPHEMRVSDAGIALGQAATAHLHGAYVEGVPSLPESPTGGWSAAVVRDLQREEIGVRLRSDGLEVSHPPASGAEVFSVQRTEPPLLEILWPTELGWGQRRETIEWTTTRVLSVPDGRIQRVRNVAGDELRFALLSKPRPLTARATAAPRSNLAPPWKADAEDLGWRVVWGETTGESDAEAPWAEQDSAVIRRLLIAQQELLIARIVAATNTLDDWAIVMGIDRYQKLSQLEGPETHAREFAAWLTDADGGRMPAENLRLLLSTTIAEFDRTVEELLDLNETSDGSPLGRRLYIYAAGHGLKIQLDRPAVLTSEASYIRLGSHIALRDYADWFTTAGLFNEIVLIADLTPILAQTVAIRSVPFTAAIGPASQSVNMFVAISERRTVGPFTRSLLEGLRGAAANDADEVTSNGLRAYLYNRRRDEEERQPSIVQRGEILLAHARGKRYAVRITYDHRYRGARARILDGKFQEVASQVVTLEPWTVELRIGVYMLEVGAESMLFKVREETTFEMKWDRRTRHVLVAGTGQYELPERIVWISRALGEMLADAGHDLIVGGWPGVDHIVAREFAGALKSLGRDVNDHLTQVVAAERLPDFPEGHIVRVAAGDDEFDEEVKRADAVVLIGGVGGTFRIFERALSHDIPVFPLPASGGDAMKAFEMLTGSGEQANSQADTPLNQLALAVESIDDARELVGRLRMMLDVQEGRGRERAI